MAIRQGGRRNRRRLVYATAAAFVVVALVVWRAVRPAAPAALVTAPVVIADIEDTVIATGSLQASQMVSVGAQVSGQIKSLKVKLGDSVNAGTLIAEIDSTTQQNELRNAQAAVASAKAQRSVQLATLKQAELAFERQKMMIAEEATSKADYEAAEALLNSTRAQIEALDAQILQAEITLDTTKANLGYTRILAPMDGTVVAIVVREGQTVNAVQAAPTIIKLAKLDTMLVSAEISEADVIKVKPGQKVYFTILGNPDKRFYGTLRSIEPAPASLQMESNIPGGGGYSLSAGSSNNAVYYNAQFEVPNPNGELRISMTAQVYVVLDEAKQALVIPSAALGKATSDKHYNVKVHDAEGRTEVRKITVGINNNADAQVLIGLTKGERVVVAEATP